MYNGLHNIWYWEHYILYFTLYVCRIGITLCRVNNDLHDITKSYSENLTLFSNSTFFSSVISTEMRSQLTRRDCQKSLMSWVRCGCVCICVK